MPSQLFCTDVDLLRWEPNVLREAAFASQTLIAGTGDLSGTTFTISSGSLTDADVSPDHVIVLGGDVNGCFPVVSVESETTLNLSVLYDGLDEENPVPHAPGLTVPTTSIPFVIRTFWAQRSIVSEILSSAAGAGLPRDGSISATIVDPRSLRRVCVLGTLQMIYSALAAAAPDEPHYAVRADVYERLYRRALRSASVAIDLDGDGHADAHRMLSVVNFLRA